ncbi:MAG TPA: TIGR03915 family putative DNA repair protein [Oligoflexia bacterium]|nr:TIGR03915 family putative DNA repair protein [Oligoflexia bacterium]HMR24480.1 TIGR03915 family putative DNA repair protein [Oligoflexia bacterium]
MYHVNNINDYDQWKRLARSFIFNKIQPRDILWNHTGQQALWSNSNLLEPAEKITVPKHFIDLAKTLACHKDPEKWGLLYRILYRIQFEKKHLLKMHHDPDVKKLFLMLKAIARDCHKMKAFVRFKEIKEKSNFYISWYEPDHYILERTASFFKNRFSNMHWLILTPYKSVAWNRTHLSWGGPGNAELYTQLTDQTEELWDIFYCSIFNPNRLKIKMMKSEMPIRFWKNLPESKNILSLIRNAQHESFKMLERSKKTAANP